MYKILLNKQKAKDKVNVNNYLTTQLKGGKKLLPNSHLFSSIDELEVYNQERDACNLIRLNCVVNPICTNVLSNTITEVVKNEGDGSTVKSLNYGLNDGFINEDDFDDKLYCKPSDVFLYGGILESIRDTQISSKKCGFEYHCGLDIFNNHIIRNNTFKTICYNETKTKEFNTINDLMRDESGLNIKGTGHNGKKLDSQHLYIIDDIDDYENALETKLIEKNGWFGFVNVGKFVTVDNNDESMDIFRVINYKRSCDFIQMTPSSDLFSFAPRYNSYLNRLEKNWNYCLTYPSSSTTKNITFIREKTNSLKLMYIDDRVSLKSGVRGVKMYSVSKHGLKVGDYINFYQNDKILYSNLEVKEIENDYVFYTFNPNYQIIQNRFEITDDLIDKNNKIYVPILLKLKTTHFQYKDSNGNIKEFPINTQIHIGQEINSNNITLDVNEKWETEEYYGTSYKLNVGNFISMEGIVVKTEDITFDLISEDKINYTIKNPTALVKIPHTITSDRKKVFYGDDVNRLTYYVVDNKFVNLDKDAQDFSFKKMVESHEVEYYVRIFSRLPNWKGCETKITPHNLYYSEKNLIAKYQTLENEFENHISQLAFAKNIYGDKLAQIVYTDDIDISYLKDNLGRPLSSIYLTILKNNKGYKEWYGKNGAPIEIRKYALDKDIDYHIEYSHCFGKLNCAFRLSKESLPHIGHNNSMQINNIDSSFNFQGLDVEDIQHTNSIYEDITQNHNTKYNVSDDSLKNRSYRSRFSNILNDEIQYGEYIDKKSRDKYIGDTHFYGDLCSYSDQTLKEEVIQQVEMRFNTAQRELTILDKSYKYFSTLSYDNIISDDKDINGFACKTFEVNNAHQHKEGYCYNPHYEIPIKYYSNIISTSKPISLTLTNIEAISNEEERKMRFKIKTMNPNNLKMHDMLHMVYYSKNNLNNIVKTLYYICYITDIITDKLFECIIYNEKMERLYALNTFNISDYKLFKKDEMTPGHSVLSKDGSCLFKWREIYNNGDIEQKTGEVYPFLNGAFYVNKHIDLFVKRQDPNEVTFLQNNTFKNDVKPIVSEKIQEDNYIQEEEIVC